MSAAVVALSQKVLRIEGAFGRRRIPHAFGGAIALAYYATPRGTIDIDVNVFVPVTRADAVLSVLEGLGAEPLREDERARLERDEQVRVLWERTPLDLFFSYDALHESCLERRQLLPLGDGDAIHILSAEDLLVFKTLFDRAKDWRDIEELIYAMGVEFDTVYALDWLGRILAKDDPRFRRIRALLERDS